MGTDVKSLSEQLSELTDEAQALQNLSEQGELNGDQQQRWDALMSDDGEVTKLTQRLQAAKKLEGEKKRLATLRLMQDGAPISNPLTGTEFDQATGQVDARAFAMKSARPHMQRALQMRAFPQTEEGKADAYNCGRWLQALMGNREAAQHCERIGWDVYNTATEGTDSAGGYLVPAPLEAAFIEARERAGVLRRLADVRLMTADVLNIPKLTAGPTVTYPGEATAPSASDQTWGTVGLAVVKRMTLSKVSNELRADALINVIDQLVARSAYELALQEDNEAVNGDGTSTYGSEEGLLDQLGAAGTFTAGTGDDTWPELDLGDFTSTMALLPDSYWGDPSWLCSAAFYHTVMLKIQAEAGGNTISTLEAGGRSMPTFLGYPVHFTGKMPTSTAAATVCALFGTFRDGLILGDRQRIAIGTSADRYFDEDVTAVRLTERIDWDVHEPGDGSDAGAYVGLSTAA